MNKLFAFAVSCLMLASCAQSTEVATPSGNLEDIMTEKVIMSRRSIRQYQDVAISRDTLEQILKSGINAPSGRNMQAYEVRVIDSPALIDSITAAVLADNPQMGDRPGFKNIFVNAPCVLFIACDSNYDLSQVDCGLFAQNIMLSACAKGIGSCCLGAPVRMMKDSPSAKPYLDRLGFSAGYEFLLCVALGYPAEAPDAKPRKSDMIKFVE